MEVVFLVLVGLVSVMVTLGWVFTLLGSAFSSFNPRIRYVLFPTKRSE